MFINKRKKINKNNYITYLKKIKKKEKKKFLKKFKLTNYLYTNLKLKKGVFLKKTSN